MFTRRCCLALGLFAAVLVARADDDPAAPVKAKLDKAKDEYKAAVEKFREAVAAYLDKREEAARKDGNKKAVDQVKAERQAFTDKGELPPTLPFEIKQPLNTARTAMEQAYTAAVKEYVRIKRDEEAGAVEKERDRFVKDPPLRQPKTEFLVALKHHDVRTEPGWFRDNGTRGGKTVQLNGRAAPHSISLHPPARGNSQVKYDLDGKWGTFRASVGIPLPEGPAQKHPAGAITFEVLGDGTSLWKSKPVTRYGEYQACEVKVEAVKVLTLRVHCPGSNVHAHAYWFDPALAE